MTAEVISAVQRGNLQIVTLLIEAGADVLHRDRNGDTALDWAIKGLGGEDPKRILKIVSVLVRAGADGPKALESVRMQRWRGEKYLVDELADMLYEAGAVNPRRLASIGDYSEISEYLKDWKSAEPTPAE